MKSLSLQFFVSGRVQKVGYRAFVHKQALKLELKGFVRNLKDGRVEVVARGSQDKLSVFEDLLRAGPPRAEVEEVTLTEVEWDCLGCHFEVEPDGEDIWPKY